MNFKTASLPSLTLNETTLFKVSFIFCKTVTLSPSRAHYFAFIFKGSNALIVTTKDSLRSLLKGSCILVTSLCSLISLAEHALYPVLMMVFV